MAVGTITVDSNMFMSTTGDSFHLPLNDGVTASPDAPTITVTDGLGYDWKVANAESQPVWNNSSDPFGIILAKDTCIQLGGKSVNLTRLLGLLLNAYLPVKIEGDKVQMVKVTDMLDKGE